MAEALISVLLEQLASIVYEHTKEAVKLVLNADQDVQSFSSKLRAIQAVLEDAEKKQVMEAGVADWLEKLKDVSYEMDDVLDEWNTALLRQQVKEKVDEGEGTKKKVCFPVPSGCFCFGKVNKVIDTHNMAKRIKELDEKLTSIANEREIYGFRESRVVGPDDQQVNHRPKTSSLVDISKIIGRDQEKENLLSKLLRENSQKEERFLVIPIVGMGGMGKTTFAQLAYNNEKVKAHFDEKVWVCVSYPFDEIKIAKAIIKGLDGVQSSVNELESLLLRIKSKVEHKKFLLVLDDVWTEDKKKWETLKLAGIMQTCAEGSTILVTTRTERVARMMRATSNTIYLGNLSNEDSLALFNDIAFSDREEGHESSEFRVIGVEIMKKCICLPRAIKTLGSLLGSKETIREWRDILNSEIWELHEFEEVFKPLLLSYYDLTPAVRRCLLYCVTFPKDYELRKDQLIELWMSQDYLTLKRIKEKRRLGENYFKSLAMPYFFQDFHEDELGNVKSCKMHDFVHDFVQFLSKRECITIDVVEGGSEQLDNKVRHLTLTSVEGPLSFPTSFYTQNKVRSLTIVDSEITAINSGTILQMKCLRTLNLMFNIRLKDLPKEIGELIHLRYMDLSHNWALEVLPEAVCDLLNLQTLDVRECSKLEKLPKGMGKLINLKHLYVEDCDSLRYLPKGIGSLKSLQVLDTFIVCEGEDGEALKLGDLGSMDQLQGRLRIKGLGNKDDASAIEKAQLGNKEHLSQLEVWFNLKLPEGMGELINLKHLYVMGCMRMKVLPKGVCDLLNLQTLDVRECRSLEKLPKGMGKLINLKHLYVMGCMQMRYMPKGIGSLKSLQVLDWFHVCEGEDEALKLGDLGSMDQLQGSLHIKELGNKDDASAIEKAQLGNKEHLLELVVDFKFNYEDEAEQREVSDSEIVKALRPHQNLESLTIIDSHGTTESLYWINSSFHNLRKVQLDGWKFCQVLPPLGKLPSLEVLEIMFMKKVRKVGVEFLGSEEGIVFPKLKRLCLNEMPNWEEWEGITMDSSEITIMPHLSSLVFRYCPNLKALPNFLYKITALHTLEIYGCPILEGQYKGVRKEWHNISHIQNLTVRSW